VKYRTLTGTTLHLNLASVGFKNPMHNRKAKAGTAANWARGKERVKHTIQMLRRNTHAVITNRKLNKVPPVRRNCGRKLQLNMSAALLHRLPSIGAEIEHRELDLGGVSENLGQRRFRADKLNIDR